MIMKQRKKTEQLKEIKIVYYYKYEETKEISLQNKTFRRHKNHESLRKQTCFVANSISIE